MADRYLFVTGKLAEPALRETLRRAELPFDYDVAVMKITVAALMTPAWIARRLEVPADVTRIMIPGGCQGDPEVLTEEFGLPAEKGPADLKRLPAFFGQADARSRYGGRDIRVFAEINSVQRLDREQIVAAATYYRDAGADVIDLGLSLDRPWLDEGPEMIADLKARGFTLSIDTLDPDQILMADAAGVDYVLSLNGGNRHIADRLRATPVLIPDTPDDLDSLDATIAHLQELGKPFLVDPIIEPIGSGFAASLGRYLEVRRRHPDAEMFMGIANLTELTEADTTGVTAMLLGFCQELGIRNVLTTEVINWARGASREAVLAAQLMYFAQQEGTLPKHVDGRLLTVKDEEVRPYTEAELRELQASITDPNVRIFTDADWIYAFNADHFVKGTDINQIFDELGVDEHTHAFYLGKELMKASIARGLGKNYRQESPLDWGYLTFDEPRRERVRLTARRSERRHREEGPAPARHRRAPQPVRRDRRARRRCRRPALPRRCEAGRRARARAGRVLHPRDGRPQDHGRLGRRQAGRRRRGDPRPGAEGVLRPVPGLGDARLQRLQHDRGDDDRADREGAQPVRQPRASCSAWAPSGCARRCCCRGRAARYRGVAAGRPVRRRPPVSPPAWSRGRRGARLERSRAV